MQPCDFLRQTPYRSLGIAILALVLLPACAAVPATPPHKAQPGMLPPPFTAEEIRDAHPVGLVRTLEYMNPDEGTRRIRASVTQASETGVTFREDQLQPDGTWQLLQERDYTWKELEGHASQFPAANSTIELETVDWLGSPTQTWRYTMTQPDRAIEMSLWFAVDHPGPPIRMVSKLGAKAQMSLEQVAVDRP